MRIPVVEHLMEISQKNLKRVTMVEINQRSRDTSELAVGVLIATEYLGLGLHPLDQPPGWIYRLLKKPENLPDSLVEKIKELLKDEGLEISDGIIRRIHG